MPRYHPSDHGMSMPSISAASPREAMVHMAKVIKVMNAAIGTARMIEDSRVTRSGVMVGTLAYLPPEAVAGAPADARSDLYSLGVTLYEMCAGEPPFKGEAAPLSLGAAST